MPTLRMVLWSLLTGQVNIFQDCFQIGEKEADMKSAQVASQTATDTQVKAALTPKEMRLWRSLFVVINKRYLTATNSFQRVSAKGILGFAKNKHFSLKKDLGKWIMK